MKHYFNEFGHEQWLDDESLSWNCTCLHGSISRWEKRKDKPCICVWSALNKLSWSKIKERKNKKEEIK